MNTLETAKKIKWILEKISKDIAKNGFRTRYASLYLEADEDKELWENYIEECDFFNLGLFVTVIDCDYFRLQFLLKEKSGYLELCRNEKEDVEFDPILIEKEEINDSIREILELISYSWGHLFTECCHNSKEEAYTSLLERFQKIEEKEVE